MPYSYVQYTGNGSTTNYVFSFPYLESTHIKVRVNGSITSYTFLNSSTVTISPAPVNGAIIDIRRETPKDNPPVDFTDGSVLLESDLDLLAKFSLYTAQESSDGVAGSITLDTLGVWDAQSRRIKDVADPVSDGDAVNKEWAETAMTSQLASATTQATAAAASASSASSSASTATTQASTATARASEAAASATAAAASATAASSSATTAGTGATTATAQANIATTKAAEAASSAAAAASSQSSASGSATTAGAQATIATTKASEASSSASSASTSASTATTKADVATAKADEASGSATAAAGSASSASSSASSASTSASNASTSATNAASSATTATTQATNAASSATAAASSATSAASSATSAASSAASAAALLDNFDDRYLGPKSSAPSVDNDGNALVLGALYFDTTTSKMRVYTASGWIDASSAGVATLTEYKFNATAGQTTFTGADSAGLTLGYTVGSLIVVQNGAVLENGSDFTASNGSSVVLASGATSGDDLNIIAFGSFSVADTYTKAETDSALAAKQSADAELTTLAGMSSARASFLASDNSFGFRNRIINGAMVIDQRNAGASVTATAGIYTLDRWVAASPAASKFTVQQNAGSVTPPAGFVNYLGVTSSSAYTVGASESFNIQQRIEGYNVADLNWGTANAKTVTLSFWVRSSLTGPFGGSVRNGAIDRSYPFSYTISSANTWEQKTVTIAGDTSGTWLTTTGIGLWLTFSVGTGSTLSGTAGAWVGGNLQSVTGATSVVGTNGATFYITGVQLEVGSNATGFEYRQYTTEFALCQRYYEVIGSSSTSIYVESNSSGTPFAITGNWSFAVQKRTTPTMATTGTFTASNTSGSLAFNSGTGNFNAYYLAASSGRAYWLNNAGATITASAEL